MAFTKISIKNSESVADMQQWLRNSGSPDKHNCLNAIINYLNGLNQLVRNPSTFRVDSSDAVQASGTVTLSSMVAADTVTVNGTVFTCVASGATNNQFNVGASDTITAANLAAAINSSTTAAFRNLVTASSSAAVVTVVSNPEGVLGNAITLAISAHGSVSGATLTGGVQATSLQSFQF